MRTLIPCFVLLAAVLASPAAAQPATAQAETLFREGKRLMSEGNYAAACEAFEGSFKKDGSPSTLMNLADCREKNQQYASAWAHFVETARLARKQADLGELARVASERAAAAEGKMSYLIISVPDEAKVEGLAITRNRVPIDPAEWNRDIPVDGGTYEIEGKAPAYESWFTKVTVGNAKDKQSVNVPRFREAIVAAPKRDAAEESASRFTGKRKVAVALWAVGASGLGGGMALELKSRGTYDDAKKSDDNAERHELTDQANRERDVGTIAAGAGVVAIGVGVYLWVSGRPAERTSLAILPELGADRAGISVTGAF